MNKERSEEIKRLVNSIEEIYYNPRKREASTELIERFYGACHIDYLIDQAERYEECKRDAIELHKQNKRYREALEFYTNEVNHDFEINISITDIEVKSEILEDYGSKARQVLRGE